MSTHRQTSIQIAHLEFHDATVRGISIMPLGAVNVDFEKICLFVEAESEVFEVWSVCASLRLDRVTSIDMCGAYQPDDYISEGTMLDGEGKEMCELNTDHLHEAKRLDLHFGGSGAEIHFSMGMVTLVLGAFLKRLEDWHGPLIRAPKH